MKTLLERERIRSLDQLDNLDNNVQVFRKWNKTSSHPHMIFYGPPGTGKSASVEAMFRDYYGKTYEYNVVSVDGSKKSERNIAHIESVIDKMKIRAQGGFPYRIFKLEEADQITQDAQKSLKEPMMKYSTISKVVIITNEFGDINDAIKSRAKGSTFHYTLYNVDDIWDNLVDITRRNLQYYDTDLQPDDIVERAMSGQTTVAYRDAISMVESIMLGIDPTKNIQFTQDRASAIISKIFLSIEKGVSKSRLYASTVKMYDEFIANEGNKERNLLRVMFQYAKKRFNEYPMEVGYLAREFARLDIALQKSSNPSIHMMSMLDTLARKFGE